MEIINLVVGYMQCNCYILKIDNDILVIDPGSEYSRINKYLVNNNVVGVIITHHHFDHIGSVNDIVSNYHTSIYDISNLEDNTIVSIGKFTFKVIYTKGHSEDSITIYFPKDKVMFVGDFIFKGSIGRCDLDGGNINKMKDSIKKISKYDDDIIIYPGHGNKTTLGYEKCNNIYFKCDFYE